MDAKVRSMTGYGRGEFTAEDRKFTVEMRSVNHRYNDITVKLPRFLISLEDRIKKKTAENVFRGKTDIYISFETLSSEDVEVKLDEALAAAYAEKLKHLREIIGVPQADDGRILELTARFPDVITVEKAQKEEEVLWEILLPALEDAVSRFLVTGVQTCALPIWRKPETGYFAEGRENPRAGCWREGACAAGCRGIP